jgi:hypothetical protein
MSIPIRATHTTIGWGDQGTADTLAAMERLVSRGVDSPLVVSSARQLVTRAGAGRDGLKQAHAIRQWLSSVWRFVDDPSDRELLRDPDAMLQEYEQLGVVMGDCDEAAILGAALGRAIGLDDSFTVLSFSDLFGGPDLFGHVYASLLTATGQSVDLDITRPAGPVPEPIRVRTVSSGDARSVLSSHTRGTAMPGALAPGRKEIRLAAVPRRLVQTSYDQGLSHFPDRPWQRAPLGATSLTNVAPLVAPIPYVGPLANIAAGAYTAYSTIFGDGSARDQQRGARASYFGQLAMQGNVAAAQILLGAISNVSSNEAPMWQNWISQLNASSAGQQTLQQAQALGPWWPVGSSDTVTNYPIMKNFVAQWDAQHPFSAVSANFQGGIGTIARSSPPPSLLAGGAAVAIALALGKPKRSRRR